MEALTPAGDVWEFDTLADEVLPLTRAEVMDLRIRRAAKDHVIFKCNGFPNSAARCGSPLR